MDKRKNFFMKRAIEHWDRLPREVLESLSLDVFKRRGCGVKGHGLVMGLDRSGCWLGLTILKVFSSLDDYIILSC